MILAQISGAINNLTCEILYVSVPQKCQGFKIFMNEDVMVRCFKKPEHSKEHIKNVFCGKI